MKHYTPNKYPAFDNYLKAVGIILDDTDNDRQMKAEIISNLIAQFESELNDSENFNEEAFVENLDDPEEYLPSDTGKKSQPSDTQPFRTGKTQGRLKDALGALPKPTRTFERTPWALARRYYLWRREHGILGCLATLLIFYFLFHVGLLMAAVFLGILY